MSEFTTFKRWMLKEGGDGAEIATLVREAIIPAYEKLPGCRRLGLLHIAGTNSYLATQHWESRNIHDATWASPDIEQWREAYAPALARWHQLFRHGRLVRQVGIVHPENLGPFVFAKRFKC